MESTVGTNHRVRFKAFELDLHTRELYRNGIRLRVQGQPIDVLEMLLERPGELVTREQLRKKLWPEDTFVDFEHSLNSAVTRLRDALGDRAEDPKYIETLPRLGYRFIGKISGDGQISTQIGAQIGAAAAESVNPASAGSPGLAEVVPISRAAAPGTDLIQLPAEAAEHSATVRRWRWPLIAFASVTFLLCALLLFHYFGPSLPPPRIGEIRRISDDSRWMQKRPMGTDGSRLLLALEPASLGQVQMQGGEITTIPIKIPGFTPSDTRWIGRVSPDGNSVLVYGSFHDEKDPKGAGVDVWVVGTMGSPIRYLTRAAFFGAGWSPDGKEVIYSATNGDVLTIPSAGGKPRLIRHLDALAVYFAYSPDGKKIRFTYCIDKAEGRRIWEMSSDGKDLHELLPKWRPGEKMYTVSWTPDGNFFLFHVQENPSRGTSDTPTFQIWATDERKGRLRKARSEPVQLASGPTSWMDAIPSRDGRTIFSQGQVFRGELIRYNRKTRQLEPYLSGKSIEMVSFSRDGKYVAYSSFPDGILWRANRDGTGAQQVGRGPYAYPLTPQLSPDASQIAFVDMRFGPWRGEIFVVSSEGGTPVRVVPGDTIGEFDPTWSPDGKRLAYVRERGEETTDPEIRIVNLGSHEITRLPRAPVSVWSPRWSPDGRYIACIASGGLGVYDFNTEKWKMLSTGSIKTSWPSWSRDSRSIFWAEWDGQGISVYELPVSGGVPVRLTDLPGFRSTGWAHGWFGLDPDDNPLLLRDAGSTEVYALTLERQ